MIKWTIEPKAKKKSMMLPLLAAIVFGCLLGWILWQQTRYQKIDHTFPIVSSPNYDGRPFATEINCVVLHATAIPTLEATIRAFKKKSTHVSAHYVVDKDGRVIQMVPVENRAWHAGKSKLGSQSNINDFSVGIEIVNRNDGDDPYTEAQYRSVAKIIHVLRTQCPITDDRIVSHSSIAIPKGRKSDPRDFDFRKLKRLLARLDKSDAPKKSNNFLPI